jgi:hypothetical protein
MIKKIKLWWDFEGRYYHKDLYKGIKNLIRWFPVIWKDRDWDQAYLYSILQKKLEHQLAYWQDGKTQGHEGMESDIRYMKICIELIKRMKDNHYEMIEFDKFNEKWGDPIIEWEPVTEDSRAFDPESELQLFEMVDRNQERLSGEELKQYNIEKRGYIDKGYHMDNKARNLLFNIIKNRIGYWWI